MKKRLALAVALCVGVFAAAFLWRRPHRSVVDFGSGLPRAGQWRNGFAVADVNGDGRLDIVFGPARKGLPRPTIFLGDGTGAFAPWAAAHFADLPYDYGAATVADFNGDGIADLAFGVHLRGLVVLVGDGKGGFAPWGKGLTLTSAASVFSSRAVAAGDVDGDGHPDFVALSDGPRPFAGAAETGLRAYGNPLSAEGTWSRIGKADKDPVFGDALVLADIDGDGKLDALLGTNMLGATGILRLGRGKDGFADVPLPVRPQAIFRAVAAIDLEGQHDFAVSFATNNGGAWRCGVDLYVHEGGGFSRREIFSDAALNEVFALASGDFDGDGHRDLAAARNDGSITLLAGDGRGGFARRDIAAPAPFAGCRAYDLHFADIDHDQCDELIAGFAGERDSSTVGHGCDSGGGIWMWKHAR